MAGGAGRKERKTVGDMLAESLREAGLLISVFGLLDAFLSAELKEGRDAFLFFTTFGGISLVALGMGLERKRKL